MTLDKHRDTLLYWIKYRRIAMEKLLTVIEVAEILSCHPQTVYRLIREGQLVSIKAQRMRRVDQQDLNAFIASHKSNQKPSV